MTTPKWATDERKAHLVRLWSEYGNRCLLGHLTCPNPSHYVDVHSKVVVVPKPIEWACQDRDGNAITDRNGNQLYLILYETTKGVVYEIGITRLYDKVSEELISYWKADDREVRAQSRKHTSRTLHSLSEMGKLRGTFSAISRTIYHDSQPLFYIEALGVSGITFRPFAKVRLASSYVALHVELGDTLAGLSKNRRRKVTRHGRPLEAVVMAEVDTLCGKAVRHHLR